MMIPPRYPELLKSISATEGKAGQTVNIDLDSIDLSKEGRPAYIKAIHFDLKAKFDTTAADMDEAMPGWLVYSFLQNLKIQAPGWDFADACDGVVLWQDMEGLFNSENVVTIPSDLPDADDSDVERDIQLSFYFAHPLKDNLRGAILAALLGGRGRGDASIQFRVSANALPSFDGVECTEITGDVKADLDYLPEVRLPLPFRVYEDVRNELKFSAITTGKLPYARIFDREDSSKVTRDHSEYKGLTFKLGEETVIRSRDADYIANQYNLVSRFHNYDQVSESTPERLDLLIPQPDMPYAALPEGRMRLELSERGPSQTRLIWREYGLRSREMHQRWLRYLNGPGSLNGLALDRPAHDEPHDRSLPVDYLDRVVGWRGMADQYGWTVAAQKAAREMRRGR